MGYEESVSSCGAGAERERLPPSMAEWGALHRKKAWF